ncbi:putative membrane protein [Halobacteriovorax marinus SJ]|uniref:Membrane protein n=1 Tax=Halobacteriovorax marinus (strain ATCC BAA-682 / DSM 15412 / SJ) TaxID=862908 RepID=E1X1C3_HALMS|nr:DUF3011 domain-containing protein [Halobacteriovorax marinus]CBW26514.1 putative membrane protein [Halobacteriovorax marinus SJ]
MKKQFLIIILSLLCFGSYGQTNPIQTKPDGKIDPLDNYIDPATQIDYKTQLEKLNGDQKQVLIERCIMFTIQNEMGQSGEDSMSPSEIESYENLIETKCKCIQDGHTWKKESNVKGQCDNGTPAEKDLLLYTMDQCVDRLKLSDQSCKNSMTDSCLADFRYQCYQYMTQPHEFSEKSNPILNRCDYDDQTKNIKLECRSYCYIRNECDVTQEEFKNRKIGNVYLLKKKSRSSCVKGSTYGINDDNTIWVTNSCHGDFAIQYKDPKCGFRPTCTPKPHITDYIPEGGTQTLKMVCDGEENETGGKHFCKVTPFKRDKAGKLTNEPDPMKEVTYVRDLKLVKKIGPAKCNPGGNGSAIDYGPRNKGLDGGWGIETQNMCNAQFEVTVKWQRKLCTLAGQKAETKDTCCNGLYWDPKDKTCNVPAYEPPALSDETMIANQAASIRGGAECNPKVSDDVNQVVDKYFLELGNYENLFSLIDKKSDAVSSIEVKTADSEEESSNSNSPEPRESTYDLTKQLHDAVVRYRTSFKEAFDQFKTAEDYTAEQYKAYIAYLMKVDKKENTPEDDKSVEKNMFLGLDVQSAAFKNQRLTKAYQRAYITSLKEMTGEYNLDLSKAAHAGQNAVWYCAHNENCSENNWLVRDLNKDEVIDFLHDPSYAYKALTIRGKMLPKLAKVNKLLVDSKTYLKFESNPIGDKEERGLDKLDVYSKYFNYRTSEENINPVAKGATLAGTDKEQEYYMTLDLFRKYSHEVPLRSNSLITNGDYLKKSKEGDLSAGIPQYCAKQDEYEVRVPIGKAVEPLRMLQITGVINAYYDLISAVYEKNEGCLVDVDANHDKNVADLDVNLGLESRLIGGAQVDTKGKGESSNFIKNVSGSLLGVMNSKYGSASSGSFMDNLFGNRVSSGGSLDDSTSGSNFNAIKKQEADRVSKLIDKRIKYKKDNALADYQKSLDAAFGEQLKSKANTFASLSPGLGGASGLNTGSSNSNALGSSSRDSSEEGDKKVSPNSGINWGSGSGSGSGSYSGYGSSSNNGNSNSSSGSGYGSGGSAGSGYGTTSANATNEILDNINDEKFEPNDGDSLFDRVTKRYIKSAYPVLLEKKKKE